MSRKNMEHNHTNVLQFLSKKFDPLLVNPKSHTQHTTQDRQTWHVKEGHITRIFIEKYLFLNLLTKTAFLT